MTNLKKPQINYKLIQSKLNLIKDNLFHRNFELDLNNFSNLLNDRNQLQFKLNQLIHFRNKNISSRSSHVSSNDSVSINSNDVKNEIKNLELNLNDLNNSLFNLSINIPNFSHPASPTNNKPNEVYTSNHTVIPSSGIRDHLNILTKLKLLNKPSANIISGNGFFILQNQLASLEHSLINLALSMATKHSFNLVTIPDLVKVDIAKRCGFIPRDQSANQTYHISNNNSDNDLCLAATAEIPLAGIHADQVLNLKHLPLNYVAFGHAFRAEAGARGKDTRGLYRLHQFSKVELFSITDENSSDDTFHDIINLQKSFIDLLDIPYRLVCCYFIN